MMRNLRLVNDPTVHHDDTSVAWIATMCGLRRMPEDRARVSLTYTEADVNCMTCLVLKARRQP